MDHPVHAAEEIDKNENIPKLIAAAAVIGLLVIATGAFVYSSYWSPPATTVTQTAHH